MYTLFNSGNHCTTFLACRWPYVTKWEVGEVSLVFPATSLPEPFSALAHSHSFWLMLLSFCFSSSFLMHCFYFLEVWRMLLKTGVLAFSLPDWLTRTGLMNFRNQRTVSATGSERNRDSQNLGILLGLPIGEKGHLYLASKILITQFRLERAPALWGPAMLTWLH